MVVVQLNCSLPTELATMGTGQMAQLLHGWGTELAPDD